jgi:hypothetical protein
MQTNIRSGLRLVSNWTDIRETLYLGYTQTVTKSYKRGTSLYLGLYAHWVQKLYVPLGLHNN